MQRALPHQSSSPRHTRLHGVDSGASFFCVILWGNGGTPNCSWKINFSTSRIFYLRPFGKTLTSDILAKPFLGAISLSKLWLHKIANAALFCVLIHGWENTDLGTKILWQGASPAGSKESSAPASGAGHAVNLNCIVSIISGIWFFCYNHFYLLYCPNHLVLWH